jgi:molybdate transport system substrate-binding protein
MKRKNDVMKHLWLKKWTLLMVLLATAIVVGCAPGATDTVAPMAGVAATEAPPVATEPPAVETEVALTVFAAASLTGAFTEIGRAFEAANPGVTVAFNFAGSNQLATQIGEGAPADVFASANAAQMDAAVASGRIDAGAPAIFATNRLVVVYPNDNPAGIANLQDLARPDTLIVLAAEEVPVGRYSLEYLDLAAASPDFDAGFKEAVLANVVSYEENVRSVLNKVALGEADAGIVYTSDLVGVEGVVSLEIPDALNVLAEYPIAPLNDSAHGETAAAFVSAVLSPEGQSVLAEFGFGPAAAP